MEWSYMGGSNGDDRDVGARAWMAAGDLYGALLRGRPVPVLPPPPVRLEPGELLHANAELDHETYFGRDAYSYEHSVTAFGGPMMFTAGLALSAVGNARRRRRAAQDAMAQWRPQGRHVTLLTSRRIRAFIGDRWIQWEGHSIMEVWPNLAEWSFVLVFNGTDPLRLRGAWAPFYAVALVHLVFGPQSLPQRPEFQPFHQRMLYEQQRYQPPIVLRPESSGRELPPPQTES
jgi:hypothetical protein